MFTQILLITMTAHNAVILKAESMSDKTEWVTKIKSIVDPKGLAAKKQISSEGGGPMKQIHSDGSLVCCKTLHFCFVNGIFSACIWFCPFISPFENSLSLGLLEAFHYSRRTNYVAFALHSCKNIFHSCTYYPSRKQRSRNL